MYEERKKDALHLLTRATEKLGQVDILLFQLLNKQWFKRPETFSDKEFAKMSHYCAKWSTSVSLRMAKIRHTVAEQEKADKKMQEEAEKRHKKQEEKNRKEWEEQHPPPETWFTESEKINNP